MSYSVVQQRREIGIRMALGAPRALVLGTMAAEGLRLDILGLCAGLVLTVVLNRFLASQRFGVSPYDTVSYGLAVCLLLMVAGMSSFLRARRGAAVDPNVALRYE